jgi:hypothetical protein
MKLTSYYYNVPTLRYIHRSMHKYTTYIMITKLHYGKVLQRVSAASDGKKKSKNDGTHVGTYYCTNEKIRTMSNTHTHIHTYI